MLTLKRLRLLLEALLLSFLSGCVPPYGSNVSRTTWFSDHGYHLGPYDDTGNSPGEAGLEGGGG
jgi:hypothetical protein